MKRSTLVHRPDRPQGQNRRINPHPSGVNRGIHLMLSEPYGIAGEKHRQRGAEHEGRGTTGVVDFQVIRAGCEIRFEFGVHDKKAGERLQNRVNKGGQAQP